ncbi:MAG: hypothetical protein JXB50_11695 [Spirochaetes bacterium]|nr:hypothetical protein [Spirochaetota bacterium]
MYHRYHFVLSLELKKDLIKISKIFNKSLSMSIALMIKLINPVLDNFLFFDNKVLLTGYSYLNAEEELYININEKYFNILRIIQCNKKIFSKAIILRKIIEFFIIKHNKYGLKRLIKILKRYKKINFNNTKINKIYKKINIDTHMCNRSYIKNMFCLIYSKEYELTTFKFLDFL